MNLYELKNQRYELLQYIDSDEDVSEILSDTLNSIDEAIEHKIENIAYVIKNLTGQLEMIKNEKDRLAKKQSNINKRIESLKEYASINMIDLNIEKITNSFFTISLRNSESVEVENVYLLDEKYLTFKEPTPNKTLLKLALKSGQDIPGVYIKNNKNLQIR